MLGNVRSMDEVAVDSCSIFVSVTADWLYGQGLNACTSRMIELITRVPIKELSDWIKVLLMDSKIRVAYVIQA